MPWLLEEWKKLSSPPVHVYSSKLGLVEDWSFWLCPVVPKARHNEALFWVVWSTCGPATPHVSYVLRMEWKISTRMAGEISRKMDPGYRELQFRWRLCSHSLDIQLRMILLRYLNFKYGQAGTMNNMKLVIGKARQVRSDQEAISELQSLGVKKKPTWFLLMQISCILDPDKNL